MTFKKLGVASAAVLSSLTVSDVNASWGIGWGPFFPPDPVGHFEPSQYAGNWYEIKRDKDLWYEQNVKCVTASYTYDPQWWRIYQLDVNNRNMKDDGSLSTTDGTSWARCDDKGNCNVKFWCYPEGNYQVLATDYTSYSLVFGCDTWFGLFWTNNAWILSRTKTMTQANIDAIQAQLTAKVPTETYNSNEQWIDCWQGANCTYGF